MSRRTHEGCAILLILPLAYTDTQSPLSTQTPLSMGTRTPAPHWVCTVSFTVEDSVTRVGPMPSPSSSSTVLVPSQCSDTGSSLPSWMSTLSSLHRVHHSSNIPSSTHDVVLPLVLDRMEPSHTLLPTINTNTIIMGTRTPAPHWVCTVSFTVEDSVTRVGPMPSPSSSSTVLVPSQCSDTGSSLPSWMSTLSSLHRVHHSSNIPSSTHDVVLPLVLDRMEPSHTLLPLLMAAAQPELPRHAKVVVTLESIEVVPSMHGDSVVLREDDVLPSMKEALEEAHRWKQQGNEAFKKAQQEPEELHGCIRSYKRAASSATAVLMLQLERTTSLTGAAGASSTTTATQPRSPLTAVQCCSSAFEIAVSSVSNMALSAIRLLERLSAIRLLERRNEPSSSVPLMSKSTRRSLVKSVTGNCRRALRLLLHKPPCPYPPQQPSSAVSQQQGGPSSTVSMSWKLMHRCAKLYRLGEEDDDAKRQLTDLHGSLQRYVRAKPTPEGAGAVRVQDSQVVETNALLLAECAALKMKLDPIVLV
ncbi:GPI-anchored surface protein, putative [Bodo saltans]|uniref:GPI-anchored surface protein, putative n=1 Tax=Bodo saltans TaxID=75058 RepID=A0A0S4IU59_BODSA|nr:GPI-anchored surface protein, putative [Bodo saltans]|eukprot:CUG08367.1 GPI-anchored surface protein, putative [Bodo saltans]